MNSIAKAGILGIETRGGAVIEREATTGREGKRQLPDPEKARAMLAAFSSVSVNSFDVTMTDIEGKKTGFQASRSSDEIARAINGALDAATKLQQNYIIRPRSTSLMLIQLDDLDSGKAERAAQHAFMVLQTSPGNFQAWVAIKDAPDDETAAKDLARRLRKGSGADLTASGATRISGSLNFKTKYAPNFPLVEISQVEAGRVTTPAALELAGIVAPKEQPRPPRPEANRVSTGRPSRKKWPSYQLCVQGAPPTHGEDRPDVSRADFTWCRTAIEWGWPVEATASRLMELSSKAKENGEVYALQTATRAADSVERQPYRSKQSPTPR